MKSNKIDEEAALWVIRSQPEPLNTDEQREFEHWLNSDPRHLGAFVRARAVWVDVDRTSALSAPRTAQFAAEERHDTTTTRRRWLLVAAVSSMIFAAVGWWQLRAEVFQTDIGEVRRITLADGSSVMLNTATRAEVRMTSASREVRIVRGEGLFEVAKDAARPFIVRVGDVTVRALGTAFSVRAVDSRIDVTVAEGSVEMSAGNEAVPRSSARLAANDTGTETSRGVQVKAVPPEEVARRLVWREGFVAFAGQSLAEAVAEINRHNRHVIRIDDPALGGRRVVGLFRTADPSGFARTIAAALGIESVDGADAIHLRTSSVQ